MPIKEIDELKNRIAAEISPVKIYLFGSFAEGRENTESDFDFYIVMDDGTKDLSSVTSSAYKAIRHIKKRPVDIVVGTHSRFEERKHIPSVENEVFRKGVLLYG